MNPSIQRVYTILIYLAFVSMAIGFGMGKAYLSIGFVSLLILSAPRILELRDLFLNKYIFSYRWIFALYIWILLSLVWSSQPFVADTLLMNLSGMITIPWICYAFRKEIGRFINHFLLIYLIVMNINVLMVLIFHFNPEMGLDIANFEQRYGLIHPYDLDVDYSKFGMYTPFHIRISLGYTLGATILLALFFHQKWRDKIHFYGLLVLPAVLFVILGVKGSMLSFGVAAGLWAVIKMSQVIAEKRELDKVTSIVLSLLLTIVMVFFLSIIAYNNVPQIKERYSQMAWEIRTYRDGTYKPEELYHYTTISRYFSWKHNLEIVGDNPLLGTGVNDFNYEMDRKFEEDNTPVPRFNHNQFLFFAGATGLIGLLLFVGYMVHWLRTNLRSGNMHPFYLVFFLYYTCFFLLEASLNSEHANVVFFLTFTLLLLDNLNLLKSDKPPEANM